MRIHVQLSSNLLLSSLVLVSSVAIAADSQRENGGRNQLIVSPNGPQDGGDFEPLTLVTKTSGMQEALDAAKAQWKDVYVTGGSWTAGQNEPVVYNLLETLRVRFEYDQPPAWRWKAIR